MTTVEHLTAVGEAIRAGAIVVTDDGWYVEPGTGGWVDALPLPTAPPRPAGRCCWAQHKRGYVCSRAPGHRRRHASTIKGDRVVAVWGQR